MKKITKKKAKSISKLKDEAWTECSLYIRLRDADWRGYITCITCGAVKQWDEVDAGHFIAGRSRGILFDERGIHAQCKRCNGPGKGEQYQYGLWMLMHHGQEIIDDLWKKKKEIGPWTREELIKWKEYYKAKQKTI